MQQHFVDTLTFYLHNFYWQDYAILGGSFLAFFAFLILVISLKKYPTLAVFITVLSIPCCVGGFIYAQASLSEKIRPMQLLVQSGKRLNYSSNIYFDVTLQNKSERDFKICKINIRLQKPSTNRLHQIIARLQPIRDYEIFLHDILARSQVHKELVLPLKTSKQFAIYSSATCF